jgi:hypothetical protein
MTIEKRVFAIDTTARMTVPGRVEFIDSYRNTCSITEDSICSVIGDPHFGESHIVFGNNDIGLKRLVKGRGWRDVRDGGFMANTTMFLSRSTVRDLLPWLQYFAETGRLPRPRQEEAEPLQT